MVKAQLKKSDKTILEQLLGVRGRLWPLACDLHGNVGAASATSTLLPKCPQQHALMPHNLQLSARMHSHSYAVGFHHQEVEALLITWGLSVTLH